ncbi:nucleotide exchange factor GrpE [bacterium]|nr:nucleotide exchange factor GrpE [bacterium]
MKKEVKKEIKNDKKENTLRNENEKISLMEKEINELKEKNKEFFTGWQRAEADFLNYKKEEIERLKSLSISMKENIFEGLLPVLDNFNLAERAIPDDKKNDNNIKGLLLIKKQLDYFLLSIGIQEIATIGLPFNAETCEAVEEVESDAEQGIVIEELQKGYKINDRIIRPAKVKISK